MRWFPPFLACCIVFAAAQSGRALSAEKKPAGPALVCKKTNGVLLAKKGTWTSVKDSEAIAAETALVALPQAMLTSPGGKLTLFMTADVGQRGPYPVLECAITGHAPADVELDFTLERGIVVLENGADSVKVRLRVQGDQWLISMKPKTRLGFELFARYAPGDHREFEKKPDEPCRELLILALQGGAFVQEAMEGVALKAPPGPALFHWDSLFKKAQIQELDSLPDYARPLAKAEQEKLDMIAAGCAVLGKKGAAAIPELLGSANAMQRKIGVVASGALDAPGLLLKCLEDEKNADVRDAAVLVLRHYLGRGPAQVASVQGVLKTELKLSDVQIDNFFHLVLGFSAEERRELDTLDILFKLLDHPRLAARELSRWHLDRLVPPESSIRYDAAAPAAERQVAIERWRKLAEWKSSVKDKDK